MVARWVTENRVRLVLHGHQHRPFCARVARPLNIEHPSGPWHELSHLGETKNNTVGLLSEQPYSVLDLPAVQARFGHLSRPELLQALEPARLAEEARGRPYKQTGTARRSSAIASGARNRKVRGEFLYPSMR